uniref:Cobalamin-binding protein n=1 Tax=Ignisphaera aggregans TaxID=334771 RepID=A0A7C5TGL6_9CREN
MDKVLDLVKKAVEEGYRPIDIVNSLADGMKIIGEGYERGELFLSELIMASEIFKEAMNILEPLVLKEEGFLKPISRVVVGTVEGDLHDIGKNLFAMFLKSMGFDVIDLGVDVSIEKFVDAVKQYKPDIVGMSALLTTTVVNMEKVIKALEKAGLRSYVKVIVGGAAVTKEYAIEIGADAGGVDAYEGALICRKWIEEKQKIDVK